jgi:hypothetical protein
MTYVQKFLASAAVVSFAVIGTTLFSHPANAQIAQDKTNIWSCNVTGVVMLPIGDRDGHSLQISNFECRVDSGPLAGGFATGATTWEWDGPKNNMITFTLAVRKPGAVVVLKGTSGGNTLIMTDGKPTGSIGSGRYEYALATGPWAPLSGKSENWNLKSTGPGAFMVESVVQ